VEQTVSNLYLMEKVTVPAFSETKFAVCASAIESGKMSYGDGIATGSVPFFDRHDRYPYLNVVTKCEKEWTSKSGSDEHYGGSNSYSSWNQASARSLMLLTTLNTPFPLRSSTVT
jgi:hypothetical protein